MKKLELYLKLGSVLCFNVDNGEKITSDKE